MVSIIIVNYNTSELLLSCVESIVANVKTDYEIIVVDNNSTSEQKALLRKCDKFKLIELESNLGFGKANNAGAKMAEGEYLFLLNPDTILVNDAVSLISAYMSQHKDVGICGGNLYDKNMQPTHSYHKLLPSILSEADFATGQIYRKLRYGKNPQFNTTASPTPVAMITGADLMITREAWDKCNGFDPDFFMYSEDADLCCRCSKLGYNIMNIPESKIIHLEGQSFVENRNHCERILDGRFKYFNKHYSRLYNIAANTINIVSLYCAIFVCSIAGRKTAKSNYSIRLDVYLKKTREQ
ncbi:MAG: glycosyltransferase family 2 protein [Bacteroidaceae bacterium]|jgi:hypothetical protein|nr:glycosyltransferase family 2 protein [Bacteroidaceae bacterium]